MIAGISFSLHPSVVNAANPKVLEEISQLIGKDDSVLIVDDGGKIVFSKNTEKKLIPASSLKVFTALLTIHYLKDDFHFPTEFYDDDMSNLTIKGYGDPLLISEKISQITEFLSNKILTIKNIYLDDSYFEKPIKIPGVTNLSPDPYNAPNGALCVNFNTINFVYRNNHVISAEPQTPILPIAIQLAKKSRLKSGRIAIPNNNDEITFYTGQLFTFFLKNNGVKINGNLELKKVDENKDRLIYRYLSEFTVRDIIAKMLTHSNNYISNQIFLSIGAKEYGPPGTIGKGIRAAENYAETILGIKDMTISEGSGISRQNKITTAMFIKILNEFHPYYTLMRNLENDYYKTGTLDGIRTRVGYIQTKKDGLYRYAIMLNTPGKTADKIIFKIKQCIY